jgi:inhibitor of cysteine peptidase
MRTTTGLALAGLCLFALSTAGCGGGDADASPTMATAAAGPPTPMSAATGATPRPAADVTAGPRNDGGHIPLTRHQTLAVRLPGNPSTGYLWELQPGTDSAVLRQDGPVEYTADPASPGVTGGGGQFTARFTALRPGATWIKLRYRRPWEKLGAPTKKNSFSAHVMVS